MSSTRALAAPLVLLLLLIAARTEAGILISVEPSPLSIPADGRSYCQVLVTVLEPAGAPAPDGTEVRLTTSAGDITPVVRTADGHAVGILTSSTCPQIAVISASAAGSSGSAQVEFLPSDYEEAPAIARAIRMTGGSLAYSVDEDTVIGSSGVTIEYRGLTIRANSAQVRQVSGQIRAQGEVTVEKGSQTLTADMLACDTRNDRIRLMNLNDDASLRTFDVARLETVGTETAPVGAQAFAPLMNAEGTTWIVCERLVVIPGRRILFYKASVYVGDARVLTMPYYAYNYQKRESILQQVRYTSSEGMVMDLPFYYRVADSGTGALKLRYAASGTEIGSYYRPRKGASVGVEEDYSFGNNSQGRVFIDSIGTTARSLEMSHLIQYGSGLAGGRADVYARYQPSSSYAKDIYNTTLSMTGSLRDYTYSLSGYVGGSKIRQLNYLDPDAVDYSRQSTCAVRTVLRPRQPIVSKQLGAFSPSLTVGYGNLSRSSDGAISPCLYQSLGLGVSRTAPLRPDTVLSLDGALGFTVSARGSTGASLRLRPTLRKNWNGGSASLNYTLNLQGGTTDSVSMAARHQLGCSLLVYMGGKWSANAYANYGLDSGQLNLSSGVRYSLSKRWQVRSSYDLYRYTYNLSGRGYAHQTSYMQIGIYRPLGPYEIGLVWSPEGQNYGIEKDKHFWLELGGSAF